MVFLYHLSLSLSMLLCVFYMWNIGNNFEDFWRINNNNSHTTWLLCIKIRANGNSILSIFILFFFVSRKKLELLIFTFKLSSPYGRSWGLVESERDKWRLWLILFFPLWFSNFCWFMEHRMKALLFLLTR